VTSSAKAAANRRNSLRSTGPKTPAGKAKTSRNALRHGVRSAAAFVPGLERRSDWERHRKALLDALEPLGALEESLADRVALLLWRLDRVARYEREAIVQGQESGRAGLLESARFAVRLDPRRLLPEDVPSFAEDARLNSHLLDRLPDLAEDELLEGERAAGVLYFAEKALDLDLESLTLPGVPDETALEDVTWTAALLRQAIAAMAAAAGCTPEEGVRHARAHAFVERCRLEEEAQKIKADRLRVRSEHILPDAATLERLQRYEAHLDRLFHRTVNALHRLQAARGRSATPAPVALDVDLTVSPRSRPTRSPAIIAERSQSASH
jgi:hypothetical protein